MGMFQDIRDEWSYYQNLEIRPGENIIVNHDGELGHEEQEEGENSSSLELSWTISSTSPADE